MKEQMKSYNGLALTPPMGWNSWNQFGININEQLIREMADAMVSSGMKDMGYEYINIDDGWQIGRKKDGTIITDPKKFPNGMKDLADYIHSKGLKFGIYTCVGDKTCQKLPGSLGYEEIDAQTYALWGVDFVKEDFCYSKGLDPKTQYLKMSKALLQTGRPIIFSICNWGYKGPWEWGPKIGNMWRTTGDIYDNWDSLAGIINSLNQQHAQAAGLGHWNDPDMLQVGNGGMIDVEYKTHMSLWAIMAAPLIAGNDLRNMDGETFKILTNKEVIMVDQDPLGIQGEKCSNKNGLQVWVKPLQDGTHAVALFNSTKIASTIDIKWEELKVKKKRMFVKDLWRGEDLGEFQKEFFAKVAPHETLMIKISG